MRLKISFFMLVFLLMSTFAVAQDDVVRAADGLRETLAMFPKVENRRNVRFYRCSIYARDLDGKAVTMADLPPFLPPELIARLTDGETANGELFGVSVTNPELSGEQFVRLMIEVPPGAMYAGMAPDELQRLGAVVYYAEVVIDAAMADEICRTSALWCNDCQ